MCYFIGGLHKLVGLKPFLWISDFDNYRGVILLLEYPVKTPSGYNYVAITIDREL